ncbi:zinc ABC transporter substrate-binding protein [Candidatus Bipolaricaulota bacterium]|nr:zinc ABC transporter substrate-binding protein [Candidatus Bipolaricaulota bacterium]
MPKNGLWLILSFLVIGLLLTGCLELRAQAQTEPINVIVTIPPQAFLVESIGGKRTKVTSMIPEDGSPHTSSLTPEKLKKIRGADIYFRVGTPLPFEENNLEVFREENPELIVVNTSRGAELKALDQHYGKTKVDRADDEKKSIDNHVWLSVSSLEIMAENVFDALSSLDPSSKEYFRKNLDELLKKISVTRDKLNGILGAFVGRNFLVYHPAWGYFGDEFKLHQVAVQEKRDKPGARRVREIANFAKEHGLHKIITSSQFSPTTAKMVANTFGGSVAKINPLERDILKELVKLAREIAEGYRES